MNLIVVKPSFQLIASDTNTVFIFSFHDGANCCDSPVMFAQTLRSTFGAQMKGILVGRFVDGNILSQTTGSTNIVPSGNYSTDGAAFDDGRALAAQITTWLEGVRKNSSCPPPHSSTTISLYCHYIIEAIWPYESWSSTINSYLPVFEELLFLACNSINLSSFWNSHKILRSSFVYGPLYIEITKLDRRGCDSVLSNIVF